MARKPKRTLHTDAEHGVRIVRQFRITISVGPKYCPIGIMVREMRDDGIPGPWRLVHRDQVEGVPVASFPWMATVLRMVADRWEETNNRNL